MLNSVGYSIQRLKVELRKGRGSSPDKDCILHYVKSKWIFKKGKYKIKGKKKRKTSHSKYYTKFQLSDPVPIYHYQEVDKIIYRNVNNLKFNSSFDNFFIHSFPMWNLLIPPPCLLPWLKPFASFDISV